MKDHNRLRRKHRFPLTRSRRNAKPSHTANTSTNSSTNAAASHRTDQRANRTQSNGISHCVRGLVSPLMPPEISSNRINLPAKRNRSQLQLQFTLPLQLPCRMCLHHGSSDRSSTRNSDRTTSNNIVQNNTIKWSPHHSLLTIHPLIDSNPQSRANRHHNSIAPLLGNIRPLRLTILRRIRLLRSAIRRRILSSLWRRILPALRRRTIRRRILPSRLLTPISRRILALLLRSTTLRRRSRIRAGLRLLTLSLRRSNRPIGLKVRIRTSIRRIVTHRRNGSNHQLVNDLLHASRSRNYVLREVPRRLVPDCAIQRYDTINSRRCNCLIRQLRRPSQRLQNVRFNLRVWYCRRLRLCKSCTNIQSQHRNHNCRHRELRKGLTLIHTILRCLLRSPLGHTNIVCIRPVFSNKVAVPGSPQDPQNGPSTIT